MSTPAARGNPNWTSDEEITAVASPRGLAGRLLEKERELARLRAELDAAHSALKQHLAHS